MMILFKIVYFCFLIKFQEFSFGSLQYFLNLFIILFIQKNFIKIQCSLSFKINNIPKLHFFLRKSMRHQQQSLDYSNQNSSGQIDITNPQSQKIIEGTIINICLDSFLFGYLAVYFNTISYDSVILIFGISIDRAFGQGILTGCMFFSACFGALLSSYILKVFSRKNCFYFINALCIFATVILQFQNFTILLVARIIQGLFIGLDSSIAPLYIKQFVPQKIQKYGFYHAIFLMGGIIVSFTLSSILHFIFGSPQIFWRIPFALPIVISSIQIYQTFNSYNFQTPRYLVSQNRFSQAKQLLKMLYRPEYVQSEFQMYIKALQKTQDIQFSDKKEQIELVSIEGNSSSDQNRSSLNEPFLFPKLKNTKFQQYQNQTKQQIPTKETLNKSIEIIQARTNEQNPLAIFIAIHLAILQQFTGIGAIISYSGDLINRILPQDSYEIYPIFLHLLGFLCVFFGMKVMKQYGRVQIIQFGGIVICICQFIVGVSFLQDQMSNKILIIVGILIMRGTFSATVGPILWLYMPQIVGPHIVPYAATCNWIASATVIFSFPILTQKFGNPGWILIIFSIYVLISLIINHYCFIQTKGLNQLQIRKRFDKKYHYIQTKWKQAFKKNQLKQEQNFY